METRKDQDGFWFRFVVQEPDYQIESRWFGPFASEDELRGAVWAIYWYGFDQFIETYRDERGVREYAKEDYAENVFPKPDILR